MRAGLLLILVLAGCDDGGEGVVDAGVAADGTLVDAAPDAVVRGTCEAPPTMDGVLQNPVSPIDFSGDAVQAQVQHKLDIDAEEDGCVVGVELTVQKAGLGCALHLRYGSVDARPIVLVEARLEADSFCPGWSDDDEGEYALVAGAPGLDFVSRVPDRTAESSCIGAATLRLGGQVTLRRADGRELALTLDGLSVTGDFPSAGDTDVTCPCAPDCAGRACGPDPVCGFECGVCDGAECSPDGQCGCAPQCADRVCGDDGCGGVCGPGCAAGMTCEAGACVACQPDCAGRECGDDGCGGECAPGCDGTACVDGQCAACEPDCAGRDCGPDGCGGTCGPGCGANAECDAGQCVDTCPQAVCPGAVVEDPAALAPYADCGAVDGDLFVQSNAIDDLSALACLRTVSGELSFRFTAVPVIELPRLESVGGVLRFESDRVATRVHLPALTEVGETLVVAGLAAAEAIAFPALVQPTGRINVGDMDRLATLEGFSALRSTSSLTISRMDLLDNLDALAGLEQLGHLTLRDNPRLAHFDALQGLGEMPDGARLIGNDALRSLTGLTGVTQMSSLQLQENRFLPGLEGLESLEVVDFMVTIERNERLLSTAGLSGLRQAGRVTLENNIRLETLTLPALETVQQLSLIALKMADLDGLPALRTVSGALEIDSNSLLTDVAGVRASVTGNVVVRNNRALATCAAEALVAAVTGPNWRGRAVVEGNDDDGVCD